MSYFRDLMTQTEHEVPDWMGVLLFDTLTKGAGHKYIRRVPTGDPKKPWRYYYTVQHGAGLGHESEMVEGAKFRMAHGGKEGHFEVLGVSGDKVRIRHDESGHETEVSKDALRAMLHKEHAQAITSHREKLKRDLEAVGKYGSEKQKERVRAEAEKAGVEEKKPAWKTKNEQDKATVQAIHTDIKNLKEAHGGLLGTHEFWSVQDILQDWDPDQLEPQTMKHVAEAKRLLASAQAKADERVTMQEEHAKAEAEKKAKAEAEKKAKAEAEKKAGEAGPRADIAPYLERAKKALAELEELHKTGTHEGVDLFHAKSHVGTLQAVVAPTEKSPKVMFAVTEDLAKKYVADIEKSVDNAKKNIARDPKKEHILDGFGSPDMAALHTHRSNLKWKAGPIQVFDGDVVEGKNKPLKTVQGESFGGMTLHQNEDKTWTVSHEGTGRPLAKNFFNNRKEAERFVSTFHGAVGDIPKDTKDLSYRDRIIYSALVHNDGLEKIAKLERAGKNADKAQATRAAVDALKDVEGTPKFKERHTPLSTDKAHKRALEFAATDPGREMIHGVLHQKGEAMATDGRRAAYIPSQHTGDSMVSGPKGVEPADSFPDVGGFKRSTFKDSNVHVVDAEKLRDAVAKIQALRGTSVHAKGGNIIKNKFEDPEKFKRHKEAAIAFRNSASLVSKDGSLHLEATHTDDAGNETTHRVRVGSAPEGHTGRVTLHTDYLLDALKGVKGAAKVHTKGPLNPVGIQREDGEAHVIMPMHDGRDKD